MNAIYARQSVDKKDSLSIEAQIEYCRKYAGEDAKVFTDKGFSGKNIKRPAFTELINTVECGEIKKIFVYRLDRFSRSIADFSRLWELLERYGTAFQSVTEQFDTASPIGRAMLNIVLVFAQLERETTAERVKDNYIHRFRLGAWGGGPAPFGYNLTKIPSDGRSVSSLIENENADVVRMIFDLYAEHEMSLRNLAVKLNEQGISGPKRDLWDSATLSRILRNPSYVKADESIYLYYLTTGIQIDHDESDFDGIHACNVMGRRNRGKGGNSAAQKIAVANHVGIIESSQWLRVQDKLSRNKQLSRANAGKYSWLTGLMKCGKCGYAIKINYIRNENRFNLLCSGKSNFSVCDAGIKVDLCELENYITDRISDALTESPPFEITSEINTNAEKILEIDRKIERLINALSESSDVSGTYISRQIDRLHKEREEILSRPADTEADYFRIEFQKLTFEEKKTVASEFIEKILLEGNNVNIVWKT